MKIAILGDTHFGARNDNLAVLNYQERFYTEVFFPYVEENDIQQIVQTGDLFDRRKYINFNVLHRVKRFFFDVIAKNHLSFTTYLGNHDVSFKNTLDVNSPMLTLGEYMNRGVYILTEPTTDIYDGLKIDFIPWICDENKQQILDFITNSQSQICFGHFELNGFEMDKGYMCSDGMSKEVLNKYDTVISGHFHHKSDDGHIFYVGSPYELTWADYQDERGFHVFDTDTRILEFVPNPFSIHTKILYDDSDPTEIQSIDVSKYKDTYVKLVVTAKQNAPLYEQFYEKLRNALPLDISVLENTSVAVDDDLEVKEGEDTVTILEEYIDAIDPIPSINKNRLKKLMRTLYTEASYLDARQ